MKEHAIETVGDVPVTAATLAELVISADRGGPSVDAARQRPRNQCGPPADGGALIDELGLAQIGDEDALTAMVQQVIATHADAVAQFRAGKSATFGFLVGTG